MIYRFSIFIFSMNIVNVVSISSEVSFHCVEILRLQNHMLFYKVLLLFTVAGNAPEDYARYTNRL